MGYLYDVIGEIMEIINSKTPEVLRSPIAKKIPSKVGNNSTTICIPSFAPSKKVSKTFTFSFIP